MTPKEKAQELVYKFYDYSDSNYGANKFEKKWYGNVLTGERKVRKQSAKQYALIAVDEIWNALESERIFEEYDYWQEVKQEINNI